MRSVADQEEGPGLRAPLFCLKKEKPTGQAEENRAPT